MSTHLTQDLLNLSVAERIELVEDLWDSIAQKPDELDITEAQKNELDRRLTRFAQGQTALRSWQEVKESLLRQ
jgi:putative addiction module component (TIGR02574 family)